MAKAARLRSRRGFLRTAAAAAASATAVPAVLADSAATTRPSTEPATRTAAAQAEPPPRRAPPPLPPLGNAEPPAVQFQAYPGGTGAYVQKVLQEHGAWAFERVVVQRAADPGPRPATDEEVAFLPVHKLGRA